jgi:hypothetical protein
VIAAVSDMTKSSDFLHILTKADELAARLNTFADDLRRRPGLLVLQTLRQETTQLLLSFTTVRARFVAELVHAGLDMQGLRDLHQELAIICRIYAHDSASLPGFLKSVEDQIATQRVVHAGQTAQEDYCSKAFLCYARGCICSLKGGVAPMSPNPLYDPPASAAGAGVAASAAPVVAAQLLQIDPALPPPPPAASVAAWSSLPPGHRCRLCTGPHSSLRRPLFRDTATDSQQLKSWHARRQLVFEQPVPSSAGSLAAAPRASTSPHWPDGSCMHNRCSVVSGRLAR